MNWDDLRYFVELARVRRLSQAGRKLGVDHSTVARRIEQLENAMRCRLFESTPDGYELTPTGHRLLAHAESIENTVGLMQEEALGEGARVSGTVRVGTPEGFGTVFLAPRLAGLLEQHPGLDIELLTLPRFPSLAAREADIIVTLDPPQQGRYVVSRLTDFTYGLFAARSYLEQCTTIRSRADLQQHPFVGYMDEMLPSPQLHYLDDLTPTLRVRVATSGMLAQVAAVRAGLGLGVLAHYLVDGNELVSVLPDEACWQRTFWLATHSDWYRLRRVKAVWDWLRRISEEPNVRFSSTVAPAATVVALASRTRRG